MDFFNELLYFLFGTPSSGVCILAFARTLRHDSVKLGFCYGLCNLLDRVVDWSTGKVLARDLYYHAEDCLAV